MSGEQVKDLIKTAIQMEKDGYEFYNKAAAQTTSMMGSKLFSSIAQDELVHLKTFQKMFEGDMAVEEYKAVEHTATKYKNLPVFPKDLKSAEGASPDTNETDALTMAMDSEKKAIDFYKGIRDGLDDRDAVHVVDMIIEQEKNHYLLLSEELEHMNATGYYYDVGPLGA